MVFETSGDQLFPGGYQRCADGISLLGPNHTPVEKKVYLFSWFSNLEKLVRINASAHIMLLLLRSLFFEILEPETLVIRVVSGVTFH